jgi:hypothetical protein
MLSTKDHKEHREKKAKPTQQKNLCALSASARNKKRSRLFVILVLFCG